MSFIYSRGREEVSNVVQFVDQTFKMAWKYTYNTSLKDEARVAQRRESAGIYRYKSISVFNNIRLKRRTLLIVAVEYRIQFQDLQ